MAMKSRVRSGARWLAGGIGLAASAYGASVGVAWYRYGNPGRPDPEEEDRFLDQFMPAYEVAERHHIRIAAPAAVTLSTARDMDLQQSPIVRAIIKGRELILGATRGNRPQSRGLVAEMQSLGWGILADIPGREVVVGAAAKPWEPNVTFRSLPPDQFGDFAEADYVKIAWTLRADPISATESVFRTETRAIATDGNARAKFRWYWSLFSPGISVIRWASLGQVRRDAERRASAHLP
jgi:hypothetical protein